MIAFLNVCCDKLCEMHYNRRVALAKSDMAILDGFCVLQSVSCIKCMSCIALTFMIVWQKKNVHLLEKTHETWVESNAKKVY